MNLYELTAEMLALQAALERAEEGESSALEAHLKSVTASRQEKLENIYRLRQHFERLAEAAAMESKRLKERAAALGKKVESLDNWVFINLKDGEKVELTVGRYRKQKCPPSAQPTEENCTEDAPEVYLNYEPKVKRKEILEDLKMGAQIPGWKLVNDKHSLRIE